MSAELRIVPDGSTGHEPLMDRVVEQRESLRRSMVELEDAIAAPAHGREVPWVERVDAALRRMARAWSHHADVTEAEGGLFAEIMETAPRLANAVKKLRTEHVEIAAVLAQEIETTASAAGNDGDWVGERRSAITLLLGRLARHRQRGADLTYEAFDVDIGGQE
jgi:hypothetical protein